MPSSELHKPTSLVCACRLKRRLGLQAHITPHRVRHILVSFVQQNKAAFAGVEGQMANLMGHELRMWNVSCVVGWVAGGSGGAWLC